MEIPYDAVIHKDNIHSQAIITILKAELRRVNLQIEPDKLVGNYFQVSGS